MKKINFAKVKELRIKKLTITNDGKVKEGRKKDSLVIGQLINNQNEDCDIFGRNAKHIYYCYEYAKLPNGSSTV